MRDHEGVAIDAGELSVRLAAIRASMERIDIRDLEAALFAQERAGDIAKHAACGPEKLFSALLRNIQARSQPIEQGGVLVRRAPLSSSFYPRFVCDASHRTIVHRKAHRKLNFI